MHWANKQCYGKQEHTDFEKANLHFKSVELVCLKSSEKGAKKVIQYFVL
jgi:hypothetical protein